MVSAALLEQLASLRAQADAYRSQAIALDAKLRVLGDALPELHELRRRLLDSSARLDLAVLALAASSGRPRLRARGTTRR
jgi:hypothetical protein